jgi:diguanylate cyclase (GGDEF)-like protein
MIKSKIEEELHLEVHTASSFSEAKSILNKENIEYLVCLVGLYLPDAPDGEIVDYMLSRGMPTIVFTAEVSAEIRDKIWSKNVIDYVLKDSGRSIDYVVNLIKRIHNNTRIKILVVDDSRAAREKIMDMLAVQKFQVVSASNGEEALGILSGDPGIRMIITDFNMPGMDGLELLKKVRGKYSREEIAVIGMSGDNLLSAKFIKMGANDFLSKNFFVEEFYCRINQNIELLEHIEEIRDASNRDFLTGLYNRRYFYEVGNKLFENAKRKNLTITVAMLDIDFFKKVNDAYGHDAGDIVLKTIAQILKTRFRASDIVARFGGEEFCIMATNMRDDSIKEVFENLRKTVQESEIAMEGTRIRVTTSIGICTKLSDSLENMVKIADSLLYKAKESGRNRVIAE